MNRIELAELHELMDEYAYFEPHIYPTKGENIMFIDATALGGNPITFNAESRSFTVVVFEDEDVAEYAYEKDDWEDDVDELTIAAYEAVRLARDIGRKNGKG